PSRSIPRRWSRSSRSGSGGRAMRDQPDRIVPSVLLVDDRAENLVAFEATLRPLGARLVKARSGDQQRFVFDRFGRGHTPESGDPGLGLVISRAILERHGGS